MVVTFGHMLWFYLVRIATSMLEFVLSLQYCDTDVQIKAKSKWLRKPGISIIGVPDLIVTGGGSQNLP